MSATGTSLLESLFRRGSLRGLAAAVLLASASVPGWSAAAKSEFSNESTTTTQSGGSTQTTTTKTSGSSSVDSGTATRTSGGGQVTAGAEGARGAEVSTEYSNCGEDNLGGAELQSGKTVAGGAVELLNASGAVGGDHANIGYSAQAGASGQVQLGKNGAQASGELGLEAELKALAQVGAGDENFGGGAAAEAKVNALLKAQGSVGAYLDSKGLTIGLDAKAEAMVSAEASVSLNLNLFGIQTTVTATARAQAGASASATALVTIGFDGKIYFKIGAGATAGIGGGVTFNAAVDAQQLMNKLGFESLDQLIAWCEQLANDPGALAEQLAKDAAKDLGSAVLGQIKDEAISAAKDLAGSAFGLAGNVLGSAGSLPGGGPLASLGSGLQSLFGGSGSSSGPAGSGTGGGSGGGGSGSGGSSGSAGGGGSGQEYKRDSQFNKWSK